MFIYLLSFAISYLTVPLLMRLAWLTGAVDAPNADVVTHSKHTPLFGGLAIACATTTSGIIAGYAAGVSLEAGIAIGALFILALYKDISRRDVHPALQFFVQTLCCSLIFFGSKSAGNASWLQSAVSIFSGVALINAINFLDVMDGLCSLVSFLICIGLFLFDGSEISLLLGTALLGFFFWNKPAAKIFMGDIGSFFIGSSFYFIILNGEHSCQHCLPVMLFFTIPFSELLGTMFVRLRRLKNITQGDASHLSLLMLNSGMSPWRVLTVFSSLTVSSLAVIGTLLT